MEPTIPIDKSNPIFILLSLSIALVAISYVSVIIGAFFRGSSSVLFINTVVFTSDVFVNIFKIFVSGIFIYLMLFFNPETREFKPWTLPPSIAMTQLFVITLALFEIYLGLLNILKSCIDKAKR